MLSPDRKSNLPDSKQITRRRGDAARACEPCTTRTNGRGSSGRRAVHGEQSHFTISHWVALQPFRDQATCEPFRRRISQSKPARL